MLKKDLKARAKLDKLLKNQLILNKKKMNTILLRPRIDFLKIMMNLNVVTSLSPEDPSFKKNQQKFKRK